MAEWLRRWTRNPMGSPRAGSNPAYCAFFSFSPFSQYSFVQISPDVAPSRPVVRMLLPPVDTTRIPCNLEGLSHTAAAEVVRSAYHIVDFFNVAISNSSYCFSLKCWQNLHAPDSICPGQGGHACQLPFAGALHKMGGLDAGLCR